MSKSTVKAPKPSKSPTLKQVAQHLASARKRLADAEARQEKIMADLAACIGEILDADVDVAALEADFEELAIQQARKRFGVEEETPELPESIGVTFSGIQTGCTLAGCTPPGFTFAIAKP